MDWVNLKNNWRIDLSIEIVKEDIQSIIIKSGYVVVKRFDAEAAIKNVEEQGQKSS